MATLNELHDRITQEIIGERNLEMAQSIAEKQAAVKRAKETEQEAMKDLKDIGIDISKLSALDSKVSVAAEKELKNIESQMVEESQKAPAISADLDVEAAFLPDNAFVLTPVWSDTFSDDDDKDELISAYKAPSRALITGGGCKDQYNWASGGGWGCTGGVGAIQSWIEFGFWFKPPVSRFYSIDPLFRFRGFYIVRADDRWYNCKYARVLVSAWTNVHQYNWKGWNHGNVLDVANDNINVNLRFDADRRTHNSYLLGGGDWAWIRCTIGLHAYAKGSGSHARNDFAAGNANYLCVPNCYVY